MQILLGYPTYNYVIQKNETMQCPLKVVKLLCSIFPCCNLEPIQRFFQIATMGIGQAVQHSCAARCGCNVHQICPHFAVICLVIFDLGCRGPDGFLCSQSPNNSAPLNQFWLSGSDSTHRLPITCLPTTPKTLSGVVPVEVIKHPPTPPPT